MLACPREGLVSAFCSCPPGFASDFLRPHPRGCKFVFGYLVPPNWPIGDFHSRPCIMSCVQTKPAAFLPRALFILCHCERRPAAFTPQTCLCFLRSSRTKVFRKSSTNQRLIFASLSPKHIAKCIRQRIWRSFFCSNPNVCIDFCGRLKMVLDIPIRKSHFSHSYIFLKFAPR